MAAILANIERLLIALTPVSWARSYIRRHSPSVPPQRDKEGQLLVDVSVILQHDAGTGIQRVVRALLNQLLENPPIGYRVRPVFAGRSHPYRYATVIPGKPWIGDLRALGNGAVHVGPGDIFLGLDLAAHLLPGRRFELLRWKRQGVSLHFVVYDILAVRNLHWFNPKTTRNIRRWLRTLAIFADSLICISDVVRKDVASWLAARYGFESDVIPIKLIPLGADISASIPSEGISDDMEQLLSRLSRSASVMIVGTLEPRKGHAQILAAFERLWRVGRNVSLVLVGKPGWKTEPLQHQLNAHPQAGRRLYWLDNASDELLELLYGAVTGVIVASQAEGFGLSLVEAAYHRKPILARDIPVFREIGGDRAAFFAGGSPGTLAESIDKWLDEISAGKTSTPCAPLKTWHDSALSLLSCLGLKTSRSKADSVFSWHPAGEEQA